MLRALLPMIDSVANLLIETSPGWWTSRHNVSRAEGASLYESLFTQQKALCWDTPVSCKGRLLRSARAIKQWVNEFGVSGYWLEPGGCGGFGRDTLMRAAVARKYD